jgi:CheY-like chemotaxis protein
MHSPLSCSFDLSVRIFLGYIVYREPYRASKEERPSANQAFVPIRDNSQGARDGEGRAMSILFDKIEALFPIENAFQPHKDLWVYSYILLEDFEPDAVGGSRQSIEFRARAEKMEEESISLLEIEFRLSTENYIPFLDRMEIVIQELGGEFGSLTYFMYKPWPAGEKPSWSKESPLQSEYMVWEGEMKEGELDIEELKANAGERGETYYSGILRIGFPIPEGVIGEKAAATKKAKAKDEKKVVMLVDDNVATLNLLQVILRTEFGEEELDFIPCSSGVEAFELALENNPDLVLLDIMMPEKSGFEVLEELKGHADTENIPVVILSVIFDEKAMTRAKEMGADRYLVKPFVPYDITKVIREMVFKHPMEDEESQ